MAYCWVISNVSSIIFFYFKFLRNFSERTDSISFICTLYLLKLLDLDYYWMTISWKYFFLYSNIFKQSSFSNFSFIFCFCKFWIFLIFYTSFSVKSSFFFIKIIVFKKIWIYYIKSALISYLLIDLSTQT